MKIRGDKGDEVEARFFLGEPTPISELSDQDAHLCDHDLELIGTSPDRSVAIPVRVEMALTSELATQIAVVMGNATVDGDTGQDAFWAWPFSNNPTCDRSITPSWNDVQPDIPEGGHGWLILPDAITPSDPTGTDEAQQAAVSPIFRIAGGLAMDAQQNGPNAFYCSGDGTPTPMIAVDKAYALKSGCTREWEG